MVRDAAEPAQVLLEQVWAAIAALGDELAEDEWRRPTDCPGWSVHDQVAHIVGTESMLLGEPTPAVDLGDVAHVRNDIGRGNEAWVAALRPLAGTELVERFRRVTERRRAALAALTPEEWDAEGFTPEGPGPYRLFMETRVFDCWFHEQDMREAVARPGGLEGPVADHSLARIPKAMGFVVGKKAGAPQGSTVAFRVEGDPLIEYAVGVEGRARVLDAVPAAPDASVAFDRRTYARLAGGRWTGARARDEGVVRVAGDAELGDRVVDAMGYTI